MSNTKMIYPAIANKIKEYGTTKTHVAKFLGISPSSLDNRLSGRYDFRFAEVVKLADWWHVTVESLAEGAYAVEEKKVDEDESGTSPTDRASAS